MNKKTASGLKIIAFSIVAIVFGVLVVTTGLADKISRPGDAGDQYVVMLFMGPITLGAIGFLFGIIRTLMGLLSKE